MKQINLLAILIAFLSLFTSCSKDELPELNNQAIVNGEILGIDSVGSAGLDSNHYWVFIRLEDRSLIYLLETYQNEGQLVKPICGYNCGFPDVVFYLKERTQFTSYIVGTRVLKFNSDYTEMYLSIKDMVVRDTIEGVPYEFKIEVKWDGKIR